MFLNICLVYLDCQTANDIMAEDPRKNSKGWSTLNVIIDYMSQNFETFMLTGLRLLSVRS